MTRILTAAAALIAAALVALAGCSSDDGGGGAGAGSTPDPATTTPATVATAPAAALPADPCGIVTAAEIRPILGVPVRETAEEPACQYRTPNYQEGGGSLWLDVFAPDDIRTCDVEAPDVRTLPNIGEGAQFGQALGGAYDMKVNVGEGCILLQIAGIKLTDQGDGPNLRRMRQLAALVVPRVQAG